MSSGPVGRSPLGWSGRAPAPPASEAGKGHQGQGARHVSDTRYRDRRDRHRYRQELVPRRGPRCAGGASCCGKSGRVANLFPPEHSASIRFARYGVSPWLVYYWIDRGLVTAHGKKPGLPYAITLTDATDHRLRDSVAELARIARAGVLEGGVVTVDDRGTGQGSVISPILANIYLHYCFDLWAER